MKVVCAWCKKTLSAGEPGARVSHGICPECLYRFEAEQTLTLAELLEQIDVPVVAVDSKGMSLAANLAAARAIGKTIQEICRRPVGNVVECIHAHSPEGCGRTIHCSGCAIRNSVTATYRDGGARCGVGVEKLIRDAEGEKLARFTISTEKAADVVFLMIDDLKMLAPEVVTAG